MWGWVLQPVLAVYPVYPWPISRVLDPVDPSGAYEPAYEGVAVRFATAQSARHAALRSKRKAHTTRARTTSGDRV